MSVRSTFAALFAHEHQTGTAATLRSVRTRNTVLCIFVVAVPLAMGLTTASASPSSSTIHDGIYGMSGFDAGSSYATFTVIDNGTKLLGGEKHSAVVCTNSASLADQDPDLDSISVVIITLPTLPISKAGTFSYSGNATVNTNTSPNQSFTLPMTVSGRIVRGNIVAKKTTAAVVTFSSSAICSPITPPRFLLKWYS